MNYLPLFLFLILGTELLYLLAIHLGVAPTISPIFDMCPVDSVAKSIVHISKTANSTNHIGKVFHYVNNKGNVKFIFFDTLFFSSKFHDSCNIVEAHIGRTARNIWTGN